MSTHKIQDEVPKPLCCDGFKIARKAVLALARLCSKKMMISCLSLGNGYLSSSLLIVTCQQSHTRGNMLLATLLLVVTSCEVISTVLQCETV